MRRHRKTGLVRRFVVSIARGLYSPGVPAAGRRPPLFVVGIGASAGGLEALGELFGAIPATGMAFVVVQHLDPKRREPAARDSGEENDDGRVASRSGQSGAAGPRVRDPPGCAPDGARGPSRAEAADECARTTIPGRFVLFASLAAEYGERAVGVVLSGADADGSLGLRGIKHAGGFTFAQQPDSARFPTMPRHAIETGCVDFVLRPKEIATELARFSRRFPTAEPSAESKSDSTRDARKAILAHIFRRLWSAHGVDFAHYKRTTIRRRIERRMMLRRIESVDGLRESLDRDPGSSPRCTRTS